MTPANPRAVTALLDRAEAAEKALEEREGDMHLRIRLGYDKTVADCWKAANAKLAARIAELEVHLGAAIEHLVDLGGDNTLPVYMRDLRAALVRP